MLASLYFVLVGLTATVLADSGFADRCNVHLEDPVNGVLALDCHKDGEVTFAGPYALLVHVGNCLVNLDGVLAPIYAGGCSGSCTKWALDGTVLSGECQNNAKESVPASIDLNTVLGIDGNGLVTCSGQIPDLEEYEIFHSTRSQRR